MIAHPIIPGQSYEVVINGFPVGVMARNGADAIGKLCGAANAMGGRTGGDAYDEVTRLDSLEDRVYRDAK